MESKMETRFPLKEKILRASKVKYDHDERFYATMVIESNGFSVARTNMTKRALFIVTRANKLLYVCTGTCGFDFSAQSYQSFLVSGFGIGQVCQFF